MKLSQDEVFNLMRSSEWLYNEGLQNDKEGIAENRSYTRLYKKMQKFYQENNKNTYELK